jgi:hypothetical protein
VPYPKPIEYPISENGTTLNQGSTVAPIENIDALCMEPVINPTLILAPAFHMAGPQHLAPLNSTQTASN